MQAQAQFTIHSLNDVVAATSAPSNPYKGQLWVNTNYSPPRTYVYNGSAWKEQNGTDTLRTNVSTLTTKSNTMRSDLDGLTSTVSSVTERVETVEDDLGVIEETVLDVQTSVTELEQTASSIALRVTTNETNITSLTADITGLKTRVTNAEGDISTLEQTTSTISATVSKKANSSGGSSSTFGWSLTTSGFYLYSNSSTVMSVTSSGLSVTGSITANTGTLKNLTIEGKLTFGGDNTYYIDANKNDSSYYIYLPGIRVDDANGAVFSGMLSAPSGSIGGFTITSSAIYKTKTTYSDSNAGVYVGTDGIGLGAGKFYVTSAGALTAKSGTIGGFTIGTSSIYKTKTSYSSTTAGVYIGTDGIGLGAGTFYVTSAGKLYASNATITGTITSSNVNITGGSLKIPTSGSGYASIDFSGIGVSDIADDYKSGSAIKLETNAIKYEGTKSSGGGYSHICIQITHEETTVYKRLLGNWYLGQSSNYLGTTTMNSATCGYLYGTYVIGSALWIGTSTTGYQIKMDADQVSFYYNSSLKGEFETFSGYVDVQGTFKTNGNAWISSSDVKVKNTITDFSDNYSVMFDNLKPRTFKYNDGTSNRIHSGFIVQEVVSAIESAGLTTQDVAAVCAFGDPTDTATEWGLRYEELISLNTWQIQKLKQRVAELEAIMKNKEVH